MNAIDPIMKPRDGLVNIFNLKNALELRNNTFFVGKKVISKLVSELEFMMIHKSSKVSYLYALAKDGKTHLRSDDYAETWVVVTDNEYETVIIFF